MPLKLIVCACSPFSAYSYDCIDEICCPDFCMLTVYTNKLDMKILIVDSFGPCSYEKIALAPQN